MTTTPFGFVCSKDRNGQCQLLRDRGQGQSQTFIAHESSNTLEAVGTAAALGPRLDRVGTPL